MPRHNRGGRSSNRGRQPGRSESQDGDGLDVGPVGDELQSRTHKMSDTQLITLLPTFDGEPEQLEFFIAQCSQIAELTTWTPREQCVILRTRLKGRALEFLSKNRIAQNETNIERLIQILSEEFKTTKTQTQAQIRFHNIAFKPETKIRALKDEIENATAEYLGVDTIRSEEGKKIANGMKINKLLEVLPTHIKTEIRKEGIMDFEEAVNRAKVLLDIFNDEEGQINTIHKTKHSTEQEYISKLENKIQELERQLNLVQVNASREHIWCHVCESSTHLTQACRKIQGLKNKESYQNSRGRQQINAGARDSRQNPQNFRPIQSWDQGRRAPVVPRGQQLARGGAQNVANSQGPRNYQTNQWQENNDNYNNGRYNRNKQFYQGKPAEN